MRQVYQCPNYIARLLDPFNAEEAQAYERLRYEWFVRRRGWVAGDPQRPGLESDGYDAHCFHCGVFEAEQLVGYVRALPGQAPTGLMLQHEFRALLGDGMQGKGEKQVAHEGAVELSRLVIAPHSGGGTAATIAVGELLFKLVYQLGKRQGWQEFYIVLEEAWLRLLNRRFHLPFAPLGVPHVFPDGTRTLVACARCADMEAAVLAVSPNKYRWYRSGLDEE
jgi:N-acyl-L-homoserine lactone synthetase